MVKTIKYGKHRARLRISSFTRDQKMGEQTELVNNIENWCVEKIGKFREFVNLDNWHLENW